MTYCDKLNADRLGAHAPFGPRDLAHLHAIRQGLEGDDLATFMNLFDRFRFVTLRGDDTYPMWRTILDDIDGSLATAAYLEAVASVDPVSPR